MDVVEIGLWTMAILEVTGQKAIMTSRLLQAPIIAIKIKLLEVLEGEGLEGLRLPLGNATGPLQIKVNSEYSSVLCCCYLICGGASNFMLTLWLIQ